MSIAYVIVGAKRNEVVTNNIPTNDNICYRMRKACNIDIILVVVVFALSNIICCFHKNFKTLSCMERIVILLIYVG